MTQTIDAAVAALNEKMPGGFDGSAKFVIPETGEILLDGAGARAATGDEAETDVTLTADADTFRDMLAGALNPTSAFMTGKLKIDGDMGTAMRLAGAF